MNEVTTSGRRASSSDRAIPAAASAGRAAGATARQWSVRISMRAVSASRTARIAVGDLQCAVHDLLRVGAEADLVVVVDVAAHETALVGDVLDPLDELVAAPAQLTLLRRGRGTGEHQHWHPALGRVVDGAAQ